MADKNSLWTWDNQQKYHEKIMQEIEDNTTGGTGSLTIDTELSDTSENAVQNKVITAELNKKLEADDLPEARSITNEASGEVITVTDAVEEPLLDLNIYGKSTQDGTPSPTNPVPIVSVGDDGELVITVNDGSETSKTASITSVLPLCGKDGVYDELIYRPNGTGKAVKEFGVSVFDGSEDEGWYFYPGEGNNVENVSFSAQIEMPGGIISNGKADAICNCLQSSKSAFSDFYYKSQPTFVLKDNGEGKCALGITLPRSIAETTEGLKTWLSKSPIIVVYRLATPEEIELTAEEMAQLKQLYSYNGVTNVFNDEGAEMSVKYWCDNSIANLLENRAEKEHSHLVSDIEDFPTSLPASMITGLAAVATSGRYNDLSNKPTSLPANGGNAATVNGLTVQTAVPANAVFTDTTYSNFVKSGSSAKAGLVPAPSTTAGTTKYLREDCTWAEVTATNADTVDGKHASDFLPNKQACVYGADYNAFITSGFYEIMGDSNSPTQNAPTGNNSDNNFYLIVQARGLGYASQIATSVRSDKTIYIRNMIDGTWQSWSKIGASDYLPLSGGTLTGNITFKTTNYSSNAFKVTDSGTTYGQLVQVGADGDTIVGAGESVKNLPTAANITGAAENLHLCADGTVYIYSNCNTIANRKTFTFNTAGAFVVPTGIGADTSCVRNIAAGTAAATTTNCPNSALYGKYS